MPATQKTKVSCYTIKMQIYPSDAQKNELRSFFRALHLAYNITFHEVFEKNPEVCTSPNDKGNVWPDFRKMSKASWRNTLIERNHAIDAAPAATIMCNQGLFLRDAKKAWETGMHRRPVDPNNRKDFKFYCANKPRRSFCIQIPTKSIELSSDNPKVAWVKIPKIDKKIKARGFNRNLWFGKDGCHTLEEAIVSGEVTDKVTVCVSEDSCGSFYISITFSAGKDKTKELYLEKPVYQNRTPVGIDIGIKNIATLSNGEKVENKHFKAKKEDTLRNMNRSLSRKWGPANKAYYDYRKAFQNSDDPESKQQIVPSKKYETQKHNKAVLERKIARQRNTYYHQQTATIVGQSSLIALETLRVKNMMRNHKFASALSDAAMSDFAEKLKYKAERTGVDIKYIGMFQPSNQRCHVCGEINPEVKKLSVHNWTCPHCGTQHDRSINSAINLLLYATENGTETDKELPEEKKKKEEKKSEEKNADAKKSGAKKNGKKKNYVGEKWPNLKIVFSKELSGINNPRYVIIDTKKKYIVDDAQGFGYRSVSNARNAYKAKAKYSQQKREKYA